MCSLLFGNAASRGRPGDEAKVWIRQNDITFVLPVQGVDITSACTVVQQPANSSWQAVDGLNNIKSTLTRVRNARNSSVSLAS